MRTQFSFTRRHMRFRLSIVAEIIPGGVAFRDVDQDVPGFIPVADTFLDENMLQVFARSAYAFGQYFPADLDRFPLNDVTAAGYRHAGTLCWQ